MTFTLQSGQQFTDIEVAVCRKLKRLDSRQRHGNLVEALLDLEPESRWFVLGQHNHTGQSGRLHLDHTVERVIRSVKLRSWQAHLKWPCRIT